MHKTCLQIAIKKALRKLVLNYGDIAVQNDRIRRVLVLYVITYRPLAI